MGLKDLTAYSDALGDATLAIYLFHGVIPRQRHEVRNYTVKHLEEAAFRAVVEELARRGEPLGIDAAVDALVGRRPLPPRAFVVSFDDGFRNNHAVAAPILEELGVPAVFYVTTGFIESNGASWTDLIEYAVETTNVPSLRLPAIDGDMPLGSRGAKIATLERIRDEVKVRRDLDPYQLADEILDATGTRPFAPDPDLDAKLSWREVSDLGLNPLFTVGGHSHTHRILSFLDDAELDREVSQSVQLLETALGEPVRHYSYPEGLEHCWSDQVIARLRSAGIVCCPSAVSGVNRVGEDLFELRRVWVP